MQPAVVRAALRIRSATSRREPCKQAPHPNCAIKYSPGCITALVRRPHLRGNAMRSDREGAGLEESVKALLFKYAGGAPAAPDPGSRPLSAAREAGMGNGIFFLLLINFALFLGELILQRGWTALLALNHWTPHWWQFVTAAFVHANWEHLLGNAFSLLVFGRMVEEEEGALGVWGTYLICGICGNAASYLSAAHTHTVSLGASSAVFGLFVVGVLAKLRPSLKRLLEAVIMGSFVVEQVMAQVKIVSAGTSVVVGGMKVGHMAHLGGVAAGVLLVLLLSRLPAGDT